MNKLNAVIVEDEPKGMRVLVNKLETYCPQVKIIGRCQDGESAINTILNVKPDVVFLDIELGSMTGFDVLNRLGSISFDVIFTTRLKEHGIDAFKVNALDYILKPIDVDELKSAVQKVEEKRALRTRPLGRIMVPISNGARFIKHDDILYCEADDNCCWIHLIQENKRSLFVCKPLLQITNALPEDQFLRVFRAHTVNLKEVETLFAEDGKWFVTLSNNKKLRVNNEAKEIIKKMLSS